MSYLDKKIARKNEARLRNAYFIHAPSGCWIGKKSRNGSGYCLFWLNGKYEMLHRIMYVKYKGEIPDGMELDHLCRDKMCCNPAHLELVTHSENMVRSDISKFTRDDIKAVIFEAASGKKQKDIGIILGISKSHVSDIVNGKKRRHA